MAFQPSVATAFKVNKAMKMCLDNPPNPPLADSEFMRISFELLEKWLKKMHYKLLENLVVIINMTLGKG